MTVVSPMGALHMVNGTRGINDVVATAAVVADRCLALAAQPDHDENVFPAREFALLADAGLFAAPLRRDLGGFGLGVEPGTMEPLLQLLKQIGRGNLAVGRVYEGHVNALQLVQLYGTPAQIERYAADARDDHRIFGVWNAEAGDGVKLEPVGEGRYRLCGAKTFASGAGHVTRPFANGALPNGRWQMCIVPMEQVATTSDPSWWQPIGMRASVSYRVDFSGVELGPEHIVGQPDEYHCEPWFSGGAVRFAAVQLGGAEALINATRSYLQQLKRTEDPYQRMRVAEMALLVEQGNLWLHGAAVTAERSPDDAETIVTYACMVRSAIERICMDVIQLTERTIGARGLLHPHPMGQIIRDLTMYLRQPAPDAALARVGRYALETSVPIHKIWDDDTISSNATG